MTGNADAGIVARRHGELAKFGMHCHGMCDAGEKLSVLDPSIVFERWTGNNISVLLTSGCSGYADYGSPYRDELVIHDFGADALRLLEMAAYFHVTLRSIKPCDLLEIGNCEQGGHGYTHLYVSVPFFFPGPVNQIEMNGKINCLQWLMPVAKAEAEFIRDNGTDLFEAKLGASEYDFFDPRSDMSYLTR